MGELRERMQQALILHGMAPRTQEAYLTAVQGIAKYYHQRPDTLSEAQLQTYIRFLIEERHLSASSVRVAIMGIRFFYTQTLRRPWPNVPLPKRTKTLPEVLSREEVARLLASTTTVRQRALLMTTYGGGLRVSEVVRLQVSDIDAGRGMLRVEQGKGRKDRYTLARPTPRGRVTPLLAVVSADPTVALPPAKQAGADAHRDSATHVLRSQGARGHYQSGRHSCVAPCVYDPLVGRRRGSGNSATVAGPRECDDHHALRAPRATSSDRARVTLGELTGRRGGGITDAAAVVAFDSASRSRSSLASAL